jgi:hypothetical protein
MLSGLIQQFSARLLGDGRHRGFSIPVAFGLSVLAHVAVFLLAALLVVLLKAPAPGVRTLIFEFAFAPAADQQDKSPTRDSEATDPQRARAALTSPESASPESRQTSSDSEPPIIEEPSDELLTTTPDEPHPSEAMTSSNLVAGAAPPVRLGPKALTRPIDAVVLEQPRVRDRPLKWVPARLPMPNRQQKVVLKKVKKVLKKNLESVLSDTTLVWEAKGQTYTAIFRHQPAASPTGLDEMVVEISTERDGRTLTTEMRMRRLAFSSFAQFVDYWDPRVAIHDDELDGRFHTNTSFNVSSSRGVTPKFRGKVTTAAYEVRNIDRFPFLDEESIFSAGIEMGVDVIRLPRSFAVFFSPASEDSSHIQILTEETWVTFHRDGSFSWRTKSAPQVVHQRRLPDEPFYIVGGKKAVIHVKGVVNGIVLVYSAKKIIIDDDLLYASLPELSSDADDYLGLVSEKDIDIADPKVTGPGDLTIYASILARGRFRVRRLWTRNEGTLSIYGSLSVGSLSATEPRYATRIQFDKRLEKRRPPNFPMTDRFEIVDWDRKWKVSVP